MAGALGFALALACGSGPIDSYRSKTGEVPNAPIADRPFLVPPDRALIPVLVTVMSDEAFGTAATQIRTQIDGLAAALTAVEGCALRVEDYTAPLPDSNGDWRARAELLVEASFAELAEPAQRMDRLDACAGIVAARLGVDEEHGEHVRVSVSTAAPTMMVDDPDRHFGALTERAIRLQQAAAAIGGAPQLHPEDQRCVPTGRVSIGRRSIAGVELILEMPCRIPDDVNPPPAG